MRAAVFLDRDGVLVEEVYYPRTGETEAPLSPEDVRLLPGAAAALGSLREAGYLAIVISNQGGHAKGKASLQSLWKAHLRFLELVRAAGADLDECYYSYAHPEGVTPHFSGASLDRKPSPYNLLIAAARFEIELARSWMIGDRETDVACGRAARVKTIRIGAPGTATDADFLEADSATAAKRVIAAAST